ncbi:helix-turn-helix domain-containing protein [Mammaliicoccus sciuri]|uniref:helix-turn-helix domain-containing protein n=1 Tax=Mammaliicoccus sciuri TaxID=1296 RepID=UPI002737F561|nr:helix-turn-helix transcriptional regulator [Mammaliicoccus sciuri]
MATTEFGLKVRTELLKRNMTNKELAKMLEISNAYLSDILRGRRDAFEQKKRIAKILDIKEGMAN